LLEELIGFGVRMVVVAEGLYALVGIVLRLGGGHLAVWTSLLRILFEFLTSLPLPLLLLGVLLFFALLLLEGRGLLPLLVLVLNRLYINF
jgi:hypothetical protein